MNFKPTQGQVDFYKQWWPEYSDEEVLQRAYMYPAAEKGMVAGAAGGGGLAALAKFLLKKKLGAAPMIGAGLGAMGGYLTGGALGNHAYFEDRRKREGK